MMGVKNFSLLQFLRVSSIELDRDKHQIVSGVRFGKLTTTTKEMTNFVISFRPLSAIVIL